MHRIRYTIRTILAADLPRIRDVLTGDERPATDLELLNFGLQRLSGDVFSCVEQARRDPTTRAWAADGLTPVGEILTHGVNRFDDLPAGIRENVLRAEVIVSDDPKITAFSVARANLDAQAAAIAEHVGRVGGDVLVDLESPGVEVDEARRLALLPDSGVVRTTVAMKDVDPAAQIVEATGRRPHAWAGER